MLLLGQQMNSLKASVKFKINMRGLDIVQTVYALLVALGLREVFLAFYNIFLLQQFSLSDDFVVARFSSATLYCSHYDSSGSHATFGASILCLSTAESKAALSMPMRSPKIVRLCPHTKHLSTYA
jgi:hypothetical protein